MVDVVNLGLAEVRMELKVVSIEWLSGLMRMDNEDLWFIKMEVLLLAPI